jgi:methanogenic corrinoid protein MtbC1
MTIEEVYARYLSAVRQGDRRGALSVISEAQQAGHDLKKLYLQVFQPTLREIGRLWQENLLTVAEEHLATAVTQSAMLAIYGDLEIPVASGPLLIAACAESERHEIGVRMLCDFLDMEGWDTVFLGASVPIESLVEMVREREPDVVALSASIPPHLPQVRKAITAIRDGVRKQPIILVGGRPLLERPDLAAQLGADLTASDAAEAARMLKERFA